MLYPSFENSRPTKWFHLAHNTKIYLSRVGTSVVPKILINIGQIQFREETSEDGSEHGACLVGHGPRYGGPRPGMSTAIYDQILPVLFVLACPINLSLGHLRLGLASPRESFEAETRHQSPNATTLQVHSANHVLTLAIHWVAGCKPWQSPRHVEIQHDFSKYGRPSDIRHHGLLRLD